MQQQKRQTKEARKEAAEYVPKEVNTDEALEDLDDLLDEIDELLDEQDAEEVVRNYVQFNGQ